MNWDKNRICHIVADLAEENPFACRALFKISEITFTDKVPTLCVSISARPELKINKAFLDRHAETESHVKAILMHEFLHIILRHTEKFKFNTPLLNIALDAVINAIIHKTYGAEYSGLFCRIYKWKGIESLLRPKTDDCRGNEDWAKVHADIYNGKYAADDLYALLKYLLARNIIRGIEQLIFLGNHDPQQQEIPEGMEALLDEIMEKMDGTGIWNKPGTRGSNDNPDKEAIKIERLRSRRWNASVSAILKRFLLRDERQKARQEASASELLLPLLSPHDRRSLAYASWSRIIPMSRNVVTRQEGSGSVNIYLDVSGSMEDEIGRLVALLHHFRSYIRMPLWVFSDRVEKAEFKGGKVIFDTTSGTSISCVFDHIRKNKFRKSIIVTDGYIEPITEQMLAGIDTGRIMAIISESGDPEKFHHHAIPYHQLKKLYP